MKKWILSILFFTVLTPSFAQSEVENLGANVNSIHSEIKPVISADGNILFFIVSNHPENTKQTEKGKSEDIWYSTKDENGNWTKAIHAEYPLNQQNYNAVIWVSPDGNRIMIKGYYEDGKYKSRGISMCTKTANGWSIPKGQIIKDYDDMSVGKFANQLMTNDGKYIIFSFSETKDGEINTLYYSKLEKNDKWSKPKKLNDMFDDSKFNYMSPSLASDGVTLYFSSNRPGGLGNNDIWMSKRLDDSWKKWSEPVNLGPPVNTPKWDAYFAIDASGEYAYMSSSDKSIGKSDIVRIKLKETDKPNPVVLISGNVYNAKTKEPISADLVYETLPNNEEAGNALSSPIDGSYKIVLPYGNLYSFRAFAQNFISESANIDLTKVEAYQEIKRDLYLVPIEKGQTVRLNNIFFDFGKATLRAESYPELDRLVTIMKENSKMSIEMSGHTDNVGNEVANLKLSEERAQSVTQYLIAKGIKANRIVAKGYGKSKPVSTNDTEEGRQLNRRVEFTIM